MEIKQLQHFARIAEIGNLTRAASLLGLTQAALSRQLAQLEAELGKELFRRNGRGLVLTEPGQRLLDHVPVILQQIARAERAVRGPSGPIQGTLVLGLPPSLARTVVVPLIEAFQKQLPEVTLRTVDALSSNLVDLVGIGKLDCAVVYNSNSNDATDLRPLADEDLYLVSGPMSAQPSGKARKPLGRSVPLAEVATWPLVTVGPVNAVHTLLVNALARLGLSPQVAHQIENLTAILDMVRKGYGCSVIPMSGVHSCIGDPVLRLHRIHKPVMQCSLSIATPARAVNDLLTERCASLLREVVMRQLQKCRDDIENAIDT